MNSKVKLENLAFKKGIQQPHEKTSETLAELLLLNHLLNKKELNIIAKNLCIKKPHKPQFLVTRKLNDLVLNKLLKRYIKITELDKIQKLNELSHNVLKELGNLQQIRNYDMLTKEDLIYALLRSQNRNEDNYFSRITSVLDTSTLDNEINAQIDDIMQLVTRLGNLLTNKERSKITKELNDIFKKVNNRNPNTKQKENILLRLIKQHNSLSKKNDIWILIMMIYNIKILVIYQI